MFELILIASVLVFLLLGSYYDLKSKELPYFLTLNFIAFVSFIQLYGIILNGANNMHWIFLSVGVVFGLNYLFYRIGIRGGGDALATLGLAIALGTDFFMFVLIYVFIEIVSAFYGVGYTFFLFLKNRKKLKLSKSIKLLFVLLAALTLALFMFDKILALLFLSFGFLILFMNTLIKYEKNIFVRDVKISELTGEEWILKDIKKGRFLVKKKKTGLSLDDIEILKKMKIKKIQIREGIPLIPGYFLGFLLFLVTFFVFGSYIMYITSMMVSLV